LAEEVCELYRLAEPMEMTAIGGRKVSIEIERRQVSDEAVDEFKALIKKYPNAQDAPGGLADPDSDGSKRKRANNVLKFIELPDKIPMTVQSLRIGDAMLFAFCGQVYSEFSIYLKEKSPLPFTMVAMLANGGNGCYVPTREAFGTTLYEAQIPSSKLIADGGYIMSDRMLDLANEIMEKTI